MAETHVLFALKREYARALGRKEADAVAHLAAVIRMFSPSEELDAIKPIRPYTSRTGGRGVRRWTVMALDVLREANEPLTGRQIARRVAMACGETDARTLYSIECTLQVTLARREGRGVVRVEGGVKRWGVCVEGLAGLANSCST